MAQPRGFGINGKSYYSNIAKPIELSTTFTVTSTNGSGITSLKSNGYIQSVYMHTSITPTTGSPNPAVGYALVTFNNNFNNFINLSWSAEPPLTSTSTTSTTTSSPYVITALGTTTLAQWQAAGLPAGFTPTVGQAFIAKATGAIGGTGTVGLPGVPSISNCTVVGTPVELNNSNIAVNGGAQVLVQFAAATNSTTTTLVASAPADGTVISLTFLFDGSSVTVDGL